MKKGITIGGYTFQDHWYLGFLGFVGIYQFPKAWAYFQGDGTLWDLTNLLWLLWFLNFLPETTITNDESD